MDLAAEAKATAAELTAGTSLHVATDPRNIRIPGGLLAVREVRYNVLGADVEVLWDLVLIGSTGSQHLALGSLGDLAAAVADKVEGGTFEARTVRDPNVSPDPVPALVATVITQPE